MSRDFSRILPGIKEGYGLPMPLTLQYTPIGTNGALGAAALPAAGTELDRLYISAALSKTNKGFQAFLLDVSYATTVVMAYTGSLTAGTGFQFAVAKNGDTSNYLAVSGIIVPAATTVVKPDFQLAEGRDISKNVLNAGRFLAGDYLSLYLKAIPAGLTVSQVTLLVTAQVNMAGFGTVG